MGGEDEQSCEFVTEAIGEPAVTFKASEGIATISTRSKIVPFTLFALYRAFPSVAVKHGRRSVSQLFG